ncbi:hypothetical protein [uncultured Alistipes sp.]|jgi:hypothetical protein|uniref:hypothetical protein n=1 Tax=uncultured Alistipes sp. TaxID=538949 RepID=UPI0020673B67|nr:hypothetical protein [uncultured Alistipes sp.]DAN30546.1 MAG TPA: acriflavine resistance protein B [Crassvirales sp.]
MEDYSTIIWVVVIAGVMIYNVSSKARKQLKKVVQEAEKHIDKEAWPSWDKKWTLDHETEEGRSEEGMSMETEEGYAEVVRRRAATAHQEHDPRVSPASVQPAIKPSVQKTGHETSAAEGIQAEITEDFDLRKAVIYSEILKPKFEE